MRDRRLLDPMSNNPLFSFISMGLEQVARLPAEGLALLQQMLAGLVQGGNVEEQGATGQGAVSDEGEID